MGRNGIGERRPLRLATVQVANEFPIDDGSLFPMTCAILDMAGFVVVPADDAAGERYEIRLRLREPVRSPTLRLVGLRRASAAEIAELLDRWLPGRVRALERYRLLVVRADDQERPGVQDAIDAMDAR